MENELISRTNPDNSYHRIGAESLSGRNLSKNDTDSHECDARFRVPVRFRICGMIFSSPFERAYADDNPETPPRIPQPREQIDRRALHLSVYRTQYTETVQLPYRQRVSMYHIPIAYGCSRTTSGEYLRNGDVRKVGPYRHRIVIKSVPTFCE